MPSHFRLESLPAEVLSGILTRCSRDDLVSLAQTRSSLRAVCREELVNYPLIVNITSDSFQFWVTYFLKENILLTRGARSVEITIAVTRQDLLNTLHSGNPIVFDANTQTVHINASQILPLPSSLRKLSLVSDSMRGHDLSSDFLLLLLFRPLPERCPHLEELRIGTCSQRPFDEFDRCIRRFNRLRKLHIHAWNLPKIPNRLSLLPASLTDLYFWAGDIKAQEKVDAIVPWVRGIRRIELLTGTPQCTANVLMILSRGGATHLTELTLHEIRDGLAPDGPAYSAAMRPFQKALTVGLQEFSLLQPPLRKLYLTSPSGWSDTPHLPLLHTAVASTLTQLSFKSLDACIFPSHLPWPRLQSLKLSDVPKMGYEGPLIEPIFPVLTAIAMFQVDEIQAPEDLFPALETIKWDGTPTPEQIASLVRHDIRRIDMDAYYPDIPYESLWEAMGGHTIDLIALGGPIPEWMKEHAKGGERIFPGFPNIQELTISRGYF